MGYLGSFWRPLGLQAPSYSQHSSYINQFYSNIPSYSQLDSKTSKKGARLVFRNARADGGVAECAEPRLAHVATSKSPNLRKSNTALSEASFARRIKSLRAFRLAMLVEFVAV